MGPGFDPLLGHENINTKGGVGEMAEWSNAAVLKTVVLKGTGGSNPSLSAVKVRI